MSRTKGATARKRPARSGIASAIMIVVGLGVAECRLLAFDFNFAFRKNSETYKATVLADSPNMGYWRLGETAGTVAVDSSTAGNTGTYEGTRTGQSGALASSSDMATSFNGSNTRVTTANSYSNLSSVSVEAWFKTTTTTLSRLVAFQGAQTVAHNSFTPLLWINADGTISWYVYPGYYTVTSPSAYNNGAWHHVVGTTGAAGMFLYIDGVQVATKSGATYTDTFTGYWRIGNFHTSSSNEYFSGALDEVAIYNYQLSAAQVSSHYQAGTN